ncbi:TetR family transcriptional regulator C-terminal domain-containing protein [Viridibacillus sp. YIM B01967]|uniref:TetR family transcriptional regulator C-terminal domain-containing protein n=1 Tax=Viridibacillus soli TaxID=2798301 RepID=A0ABS1H3B2_9BACL|nr:TetR family transcriptional regulator C-terminal domain-containing protein [Viridibacillus soli]MBK3493895.1 TetR family transcriptional regulator C-terminal domain-containing protein [Viridibacillus soli]
MWLEFVSYKLRKKELKEDGVKQIIERIMHHLQDSQLLKDGLQLEEEIIHLHAFIDGLALHILMGFVPVDSERIRYLIERELDKLFK